MTISRNKTAVHPMHDMLAEPLTRSAAATAVEPDVCVRLSATRPGDRGVIVDVGAATHPQDHGVNLQELQRRLLEFGFVEGAEIEVLHEGAIRHDPIAVRLDDMRVALRRRDAEDIWIRLAPRPAEGRAAGHVPNGRT